MSIYGMYEVSSIIDPVVDLYMNSLHVKLVGVLIGSQPRHSLNGS